MLEIIVLLQLVKPIQRIAVAKGEKPNKWKAITVAAWFGAELAAAVFAYAVSNDTATAYGAALAAAVMSYFLVRYKVKQLPDRPNDLLDTIGQEQTT